MYWDTDEHIPGFGLFTEFSNVKENCRITDSVLQNLWNPDLVSTPTHTDMGLGWNGERALTRVYVLVDAFMFIFLCRLINQSYLCI